MSDENRKSKRGAIKRQRKRDKSGDRPFPYSISITQEELKDAEKLLRNSRYRNVSHVFVEGMRALARDADIQVLTRGKHSSIEAERLAAMIHFFAVGNRHRYLLLKASGVRLDYRSDLTEQVFVHTSEAEKLRMVDQILSEPDWQQFIAAVRSAKLDKTSPITREAEALHANMLNFAEAVGSWPTIFKGLSDDTRREFWALYFFEAALFRAYDIPWDAKPHASSLSATVADIKKRRLPKSTK